MSQSAPRLDDLRIDRSVKRPASPGALPWVIVALLLAGGAAAAWWWSRPQRIAVRTVVARATAPAAGVDRTVLNASGYVVARREATVSSKIMGKVLEVRVEEGFRVKQDEVLARLDATNVQASLDLARAQLTSADRALEETRVRLRDAERDLQRQHVLQQSKVAAEADYQHAETAVLALRARLAQQQSELAVAERSLAVWQQQLDDTIIRAPFAGVVTSKNAQPGEMISPMSSGGFTRTGICTIVDMQSLEIEIDVNESYINRVVPGQPVTATLDAYPDWKVPCRVIAIIPTADRQKATVRTRVGFEQLDPRILPQMSVKVAFQESGASPSAAPAAGVVSIPKSAVRREAGRESVFVVNNGRAERRAIKVAGAQGEEVLIAAGVAAGDTVIVEAAAGLNDGAAIRPSP